MTALDQERRKPTEKATHESLFAAIVTYEPVFRWSAGLSFRSQVKECPA